MSGLAKTLLSLSCVCAAGSLLGILLATSESSKVTWGVVTALWTIFALAIIFRPSIVERRHKD
jgi:hypothetical protein